MKRRLSLVTIITTVLVIGAVVIQPAFKFLSSPLEYKIEEAMTVWSLKKAQKGDPTYENDYTIWDFGIRYNYAVLKEYVNIELLGELAGTPVFASGPHGDGIDFNSDKFGYYNPDFLEQVENTLDEGMKRSAFNTVAQAVYNSQIEKMARVYHDAYIFVNNEQNIDVSYTPDYYKGFSDFAASEHNSKGYDWSNSYVACRFWLRRRADGTDKKFFKILKKVLNTYDKGFLKENTGSTTTTTKKGLGATIQNALSSWTSAKSKKGEMIRSVDHTWLNFGIRYNYAILKDYININKLATITGEPVFVSGPHTNGIDYNSAEFGHYNPAFLTKVKTTLEKSMKNKLFNTIASKYYNDEVAEMATIYYRAYLHLQKEGDIIEKYGNNYDQETFRAYADSERKLGYNWYQSDVAAGFWVRRAIDGTDKQFFEILKMVMMKYEIGK